MRSFQTFLISQKRQRPSKQRWKNSHFIRWSARPRAPLKPPKCWYTTRSKSWTRGGYRHSGSCAHASHCGAACRSFWYSYSQSASSFGTLRKTRSASNGRHRRCRPCRQRTHHTSPRQGHHCGHRRVPTHPDHRHCRIRLNLPTHHLRIRRPWFRYHFLHRNRHLHPALPTQ